MIESKQALELKGLSVGLIVGTTPLKQRNQVLESFAKPSGPDVVLISEVASTGVNLATAHVLIIVVGQASI